VPNAQEVRITVTLPPSLVNAALAFIYPLADLNNPLDCSPEFIDQSPLLIVCDLPTSGGYLIRMYPDEKKGIFDNVNPYTLKVEY
jgi:hypothetical protein